MKKSLVVVLSVLFLGLYFSACNNSNSSNPPPPANNNGNVQTLSTGTWGGSDAQMQVGSNSTTIQFDCAHAQINGPITQDASGNFDAAGFITTETGENSVKTVARFTGVVTGNNLTLTVSTCNSTKTFNLTLGNNGSLVNSCAPASSPTPAPSATTSPSPVSHAVPTGEWGGQHIDMMVTNTGATYQLDCGHGTIDQKIVTDAAGNFHDTGTFTREGGPTPNPTPSPVPATYSGNVTNNVMKLKISSVNGATPFTSNFTLIYGQQGHLVRCQ